MSSYPNRFSSPLQSAVLQNQPPAQLVGYPSQLVGYPSQFVGYPQHIAIQQTVFFNPATGTVGIRNNSPYTSSSSSSKSKHQAIIEKRQNNDYYKDNPLGWFRN